MLSSFPFGVGMQISQGVELKHRPGSASDNASERTRRFASWRLANWSESDGGLTHA
jgi:hypothetical protein